MSKAKKEIIELLRSGNFTIIYWDNEGPELYKGHWNKDKEYKKDEYETMNKSIVPTSLWFENGYCPGIVTLLVEALKGKSDSI